MVVQPGDDLAFLGEARSLVTKNVIGVPPGIPCCANVAAGTAIASSTMDFEPRSMVPAAALAVTVKNSLRFIPWLSLGFSEILPEEAR